MRSREALGGHHVCGVVVLAGVMVWLVIEIVAGLARVIGS